jgi:hypothetical protein
MSGWDKEKTKMRIVLILKAADGQLINNST